MQYPRQIVGDFFFAIKAENVAKIRRFSLKKTLFFRKRGFFLAKKYLKCYYFINLFEHEVLIIYYGRPFK